MKQSSLNLSLFKFVVLKKKSLNKWKSGDENIHVHIRIHIRIPSPYSTSIPKPCELQKKPRGVFFCAKTSSRRGWGQVLTAMEQHQDRKACGEIQGQSWWQGRGDCFSSCPLPRQGGALLPGARLFSFLPFKFCSLHLPPPTSSGSKAGPPV